MASLRYRSESGDRAGEGSRSKRMGGVMETSKEEFSPALTRIARGEADKARLGVPSTTQARAQTRIPQNPSSRKPSNSSTGRPPLTHENQSWGSTSTSSNRSVATAIPSSTSSIRDRDAALKQPRNVLRRKQSTISREAAKLRDSSRTSSGRTSSSSSVPRSQISAESNTPQLDRYISESPVEFQSAQLGELPSFAAQAGTMYPELDRYRYIPMPRAPPGNEALYKLATEDLPPPTPLFSGASSHSQLSTFSGSPSTRFAESPGPGPYSRDTTPTSMSSASPGLVAPLRNPVSRPRQASPADTRPPVTRRRAGSIPNDGDAFNADPHGLAAVRETSMWLSSNSATRSGDKKDKKKKKALSPSPPNPPPRKSSQKFKKDQEEDASPSKSARTPAQSVMRSPSPSWNTSRPFTSPQPRATPPSRPSRDGTPDLYSQFGGPVPIIQSNLSSTSIAERRQSNQLVPSLLPRSTTPSSQDRPQDRPKLSKPPVGREPTPAPRGATPVGTQTVKAESGTRTRTPSPNVSTFKSRFGLFGRRKTDTEVVQVDKKDKSSRKGPAAGTGHEGYGRIGTARRRSSSGTSTTPRGPGATSDNSQSTDAFLLERMNPVVIAGGEIIENRNTSSELARTDSDQSLAPPRPSVESRAGSSLSLASREDSRNTLWPSAFPRKSAQSRRPSDSSDSEAAVTMKSTLAFRRSVQRLRSSPDQEPLKLPKPIVTRGIASPSVGSIDTTILTDDSMASSRPEPGRSRDEPSTAPKKLTKRVKSPRTWNLFGRSHSQPAPAPKKEEVREMPAPIVEAPNKPVAFYTMMDSSEQEDTDETGVHAALRAAEVLGPSKLGVNGQQRRPSLSSPQEKVSSSRSASRLATHPARAVTPLAEARPASAPRVSQSKPAVAQAPQAANKGRPSRLPQVGRIPKVVNTRPEQTSPKSFSRPFNRISLQLAPLRPTQVDQNSVAKGPTPPRPSTPELARDKPTVATGSSISPPKKAPQTQDPSSEPSQAGKEFLSFSPRKNSVTSTTSSCSGVIVNATHTAVVPVPTAPLAEDEIWDEYNDLFGDVPPSATSSRGVPFHLETYESRLVKKVGKPLESPTIKIHHIQDNRDSVEMGKAATASSHFSADMTARINAAFRFGPEPPSTPFSVSEFVSGYGDRNNSVESKKHVPSSPRDSSSSNKSTKIRMSNSSSASEETPLSQVNLRVGSMTVSKWLTFGHVLFSPAREELIPVVGSLKRHSILVIDGLGNDDWSFYAAETYPAATFFNMSPRAPLSQEHRTTSFPLSPPNHHQIQYNSHLDKFPFGPESFTTVVFRFPSAAPEGHYRNIVAEARRVLKPGGYMELSILDVDLNNMGNRSRRAVRRLKERVSTRNPDYNLSSTADLMLRLLGKRGFSDIKTCRVGVPVASTIANSSGSEGGSKKKKDERSLAEMMNDDTEMGDENITKMVAKVGRWWYNRLYETPSGQKNSVWNDKALLAECEEWKTSLKLMVCHAKVPESRGRVSSI